MAGGNILLNHALLILFLILPKFAVVSLVLLTPLHRCFAQTLCCATETTDVCPRSSSSSRRGGKGGVPFLLKASAHESKILSTNLPKQKNKQKTSPNKNTPPNNETHFPHCMHFFFCLFSFKKGKDTRGMRCVFFSVLNAQVKLFCHFFF